MSLGRTERSAKYLFLGQFYYNIPFCNSAITAYKSTTTNIQDSILIIATTLCQCSILNLYVRAAKHYSKRLLGLSLLALLLLSNSCLQVYLYQHLHLSHNQNCKKAPRSSKETLCTLMEINILTSLFRWCIYYYLEIV